ncbi:MAG: hypothetical protein EBZ76_12790 [Synechococcaceae bacterium WB9_2_170]|nr:hypothetical protein [Synechococcaceae bacterium WB9_2_170]
MLGGQAMLIQTGRGSISFVAGCSWVNSVKQATPFKSDLHAKQSPSTPPQPTPQRWPWAS